MRLALICGRRGSTDELRTLVGPGAPREVRDTYKEMLARPGDLREIQLWDSQGGVVKRKTFNSSAPESPDDASPAAGDDAAATADEPVVTDPPAATEEDDAPTLESPRSRRR